MEEREQEVSITRSLPKRTIYKENRKQEEKR